jgi:hypothetical protein
VPILFTMDADAMFDLSLSGIVQGFSRG